MTAGDWALFAQSLAAAGVAPGASTRRDARAKRSPSASP